MSAETKPMSRPEVREVKDARGTRGLEVSFEVAASPERALAALWEIDNFPRLFPDVREARVISRSEDRMEVAFRVDAVLREVRYTLGRKLLSPQREIRWHLVQGDLKAVSGAWKVEPAADPARCRLTYRTFIDVGFFVPSVVIQKLAHKKAAEMIERLQRELRAICQAMAQDGDRGE